MNAPAAIAPLFPPAEYEERVSRLRVEMDARDLGTRLAKALLKRREEEDAQPTTTLQPVALAVRGSTGPPPG